MLTLGEKIRVLRNEKNLSQEALGEEVGVSRGSVVKWEQNIVKPNMDSMALLCKFFKVDANYFLEDEIQNAKLSDIVDETAISDDTEYVNNIKKKRKLKIYIALITLFSILAIFSIFFTVSASFSAFSSNVGYIEKSTIEHALVWFIVSLLASLVFLFLICLMIYFIKNLKSR